MEEKYMRRAIELARRSAEADEVPVGAVVVKNGIIIAESENRKERDNCSTSHAEMLAIAKATEVVGNWWLEDCEIYVTLEPCAMCAMAMVLSRIKALYFGAYDEKTGASGSKINIFEKGLFNHTIEVTGGVLQSECSGIVSDFFKKKRAEKKNKQE